MKNVLKVPKGKCPLDFLAELGERISKAWLFVDNNVFNNISSSLDDAGVYSDRTMCFRCEATEEYPSTEIIMKRVSEKWFYIISIKAEDIAFTKPVSDPEEVFFMEMAD